MLYRCVDGDHAGSRARALNGYGTHDDPPIEVEQLATVIIVYAYANARAVRCVLDIDRDARTG